MTDWCIRNARILDPATGYDARGDVVIANGKILAVGSDLDAEDGAQTLNANGLCLAPGLIDLRVKTGEPGHEQYETLATASAAAVSGGVTTMAIMPDTAPVIDDVALVEFIARRGAAEGLNRIYPVGALTQKLKGDSIAEIGLMADAGALFFSNGEHAIADASVMKRALIYAAGLGASICTRPRDASLAGSGVMNAGALAAQMGLSGLDHETELVVGLRDIALARKAGARLILDQVSTPELLAAIARAKSEGTDIHCTLAAHHLFFNERDVGDYLTYCKVDPPFRTEEVRQHLITAVKDGIVDAVVSAHDPQPPEVKRLPFAEAAFGAAGLETTLAAMLSLFHDGYLTLLEALRPLTCGPADLAGLPMGRIAEGKPADLILFDPDQPWLCTRDGLKSRSTNSPFDGRRLQGCVLQTWVGGELVFKRG
ncbi:MAG: dihydroorotase [Pseudomonadota bacterium]